MQTREKHLYHGAAITQIVEHDSFKALNKASDAYGHYLINHDCRLHVKYTKSNRWSFTFQTSDIARLSEDLALGNRVFVCLVCSDETVCVLDAQDIQSVLDLAQDTQQWVHISVPDGGSMHVKGYAGELDHAVYHNAFPGMLFEEADAFSG
jgi:hypothetical protein